MPAETTIPSYRPAERTAWCHERQSLALARTQHKLALVIPSMREGKNLLGLLSRVRDVLASRELPWEILVVDDDSRDGTEEIVSAVARKDPRVRLLVRRGERGLSGAILHGWQHTNATILGVIDADGQHPPELMPALLTAILEGGDLAIGSRYAKGGSGGGCNPLRRLISTAAIWAARPLQPGSFRVKDPLSGFFLVRRHCVENLTFQSSGFKLLLEILVRGRIESVKELPFKFARRKAGHSKVSPKVAWDYLVLLARLYRAKFGVVRNAQAAPGD